MTPESISELNQALDAAGVDYTSGLQRHWDRLLPLLDRTLASGFA